MRLGLWFRVRVGVKSQSRQNGAFMIVDAHVGLSPE